MVNLMSVQEHLYVDSLLSVRMKARMNSFVDNKPKENKKKSFYFERHHHHHRRVALRTFRPVGYFAIIKHLLNIYKA